MLSKLEYFNRHSSIAVHPQWMDQIRDVLADRFSKEPDRITLDPVKGGTLGLCAFFTIDGRRRFLKTHLPDERCRINLEKEIRLLGQAYGDKLEIESLDFIVGGNLHLCLIMPELAPAPTGLGPDGAIALVNSYAGNLASDDARSAVAHEFSFRQLVDEGYAGLEALQDKGLLAAALCSRLILRLDSLRRDEYLLTPQVCHGDFGPKNIMANGQDLVAIDWEDAFEGVVGYDYVYWLSFMENRQYYPVAFGRTACGADTELSMLVLILILKSALAVRSGAYLGYKTPLDARLGEVLEMAA